MERISIFNYEAFYLDYLEGNLSEEDTKMLLAFLEEHPECRMEDEELLILDDAESLTFGGKQNLKQVDESGPIAIDNVEHFMIADAEGLLTEEKKAELNTIVANDEKLEATRRRYNAVYFTPDESVVYGAKSNLKQRKTIVLWPYMSGAVAAAAVVVVMLMTNTFEGTVNPVEWDGTAQVETNGNQNSNQGNKNGNGTKVTPVNDNSDSDNNGSANVYVASAGTNSGNASHGGGTSSKKPVVRLNAMDRRGDIQISTASIDGDVASRPQLGEPYAWEKTTPIQTFGPDLENPIEPITAFIAKKSKKDVDFKRRKATEEKKGGFLLKIGKFELSRNKH
ncbi:MAG: hypothetical protein NXI10_01020 [bacterium]|nr:hypothetical protein [bacterium]